MATKFKRLSVTLNDNDRQKLQKLSDKNQLTKSKMIAKLLNQKPVQVDQQELLNTIQLLEKIERELSGIGININQYQHQINKAMLEGQFDKDEARLLQSSWDLRTETEVKQKIDDLAKGLSKYVNY